MTQKPRKEDFRKLKSQKNPVFIWCKSRSTWKLRKRSVPVFKDPSLHVYSLSISDVKYYLTRLIKYFNNHALKTSRLEVKDIFYFWKYVRTSKHVKELHLIG